MKRIIFSVAIFLILILSLIGIAYAEDVNQKITEETKIGSIISEQLKPEEIMAKGVILQKPKGMTETHISFTEEGAYVKLNGGELNNIQPFTKNRNAFVKFDERGRIISADFYTNKFGGEYLFGNDLVLISPNTKVFYEKGILKLIPTESLEVKEEPKKISNPNKELPYNKIEYVIDKNIKITFPDKNILEKGKITYKEGKYYIEKDSIIDGIKIKDAYQSQSTPQPVRIFFDGEKHETSNNEGYLSLSAQNKKLRWIINGYSNMGAEFQSGNPFIKMDDEQTFSLISIAKHIDLEITNQNTKIPKMTIHEYSGDGSGLIFNTGKNAFGINNKNELILYMMPEGKGRFVDIAVDSDDKIKNALILTGKNEYISLNKDSSLYKSKVYLGSNLEVSEETQKRYAELLRESLPNVKLNGLELSTEEEINHIKERIKELPQEMREAVKVINLRTEFSKVTNEGGLLIGSANMAEEGVMNIMDISSIDEVLPHEIAHVLQIKLDKEAKNRIEEQELSALSKELGLRNKLTKEDVNWGDFWYNPSLLKTTNTDLYTAEEKNKITKNLYGARNALTYAHIEDVSSTFTNEWETVNGRKMYHEPRSSQAATGFVWRPDPTFGKENLEWPDGTSNPKGGFIRPYGQKNVFEDVATFTEAAYSKTELFTGLLKNDNPNRELYKNKIDLLLKYNFITPEKYKEIIRIGNS